MNSQKQIKAQAKVYLTGGSNSPDPSLSLSDNEVKMSDGVKTRAARLVVVVEVNSPSNPYFFSNFAY